MGNGGIASLRQEMEVSGQLHAPAAVTSGKQLPAPIV
jgi:hypothetical protein